jgi:hypothetical protein
MKSIRTTLLLVAGLFALAIGANSLKLRAQQPGSSPPPPARIEPAAQQFLDRTIQALGGPAFLSAKSLSSSGRMFFFIDGNTAGMEPFVSQTLYPNKNRTTISKAKKHLSMDTGNLTYEGESKPITLVNNDDMGWEIDQFGTIPQTDKQLKGWMLANRFTLTNLLRLEIHKPGVLIQKGIVDFVDNVPTQVIDIIEPGGNNIRLDLDKRTSLPMRVTYRVRNPQINDWDEYSDAYADYKPIDGILTPMHVTRFLNGDRIGETFRNEARYNQDYPAGYFTANAR